MQPGRRHDADCALWRVFRYCATALVRVPLERHSPWYETLGAWFFPFFVATFLGAYLEKLRHGLALTVAVSALLAAVAAALTLLTVYA